MRARESNLREFRSRSGTLIANSTSRALTRSGSAKESSRPLSNNDSSSSAGMGFSVILFKMPSRRWRRVESGMKFHPATLAAACAQYHGGARSHRSHALLQSVVRGFLGDDRVMHVALAQAGRAHPHELGPLVQLVDGLASAVPHPCSAWPKGV